MPKRRLPGRCVHCLKQFDVLTWDHVLPDSWYPDGVYNLEKWEVPACEKCNNDLSKVEEGLLTKLGLSLDPQELRSLGIPDRVLRSLNPLFGKNERDRTYRQKKREKVLKGIRVFQDLPEEGIFPNFGPSPISIRKEYAAVLIDPDEVKKFTEKVIRGIAYVADQSFIDDTYDIELFVVDEGKATEMKTLVDERGVTFDRGQAFLVKRLLIENDRVGGIYFIEIWGRFRCYVVVSPKRLRENVTGA